MSKAIKTEECLPGYYGVSETTLLLPEEVPLVGFHGRTDGEVLTSLGLILLNTMDPTCNIAPAGAEPQQIYGGSIFEQSERAEEATTEKDL